MRITDRKYFKNYHLLIGHKIDSLIGQFDFSEKAASFDYLTKASAVYSSNIEGNSVDLNSFMNYEMNREKFGKEKEIEEIENLIEAYQFAQNNRLNEDNFLHCHKVSSKTLLIKSKRGAYRTESVGVFGKSGLAYLAVEAEFVPVLMKEFFEDMNQLLTTKLSNEEVFYFASLIHLRFVHIHPFMDGNGRMARLLEKWFIAEKSGKRFWKIPSEKYYKDNQQTYYRTLNLGVNYYELNYEQCLDFLVLLPNCLKGTF